MAFRPEVSLGLALATIAVTGAVFTHALPPHADMASAPSDNVDLDAARKKATWLSAGVVGAISLLAKDPMIFIVGGTAVVVMDMYARHSIAVDPNTGKLPAPGVPAQTIPMAA